MSTEVAPAAAGSTIPVEFAVALGRIEEGQKNLKGAVDEFKREIKVDISGVRSDLGGVIATQTDHATEIATLKAWRDSTEKTLEERKPNRAPWWIILGAIFGSITGIGGIIVIVTVLGQVSAALQSIAP